MYNYVYPEVEIRRTLADNNTYKKLNSAHESLQTRVGGIYCK